MAYSRVTKIGDGVSTQFPVNFALGYISQGHITARVGTEADGLGQPIYRAITYLSENLLQIAGTPAGIGVPILFERTVPKEALLVEFNNGDVMDEVNLDIAQKQSAMLAHEVLDGRFATLTENLRVGGFKLSDVGTPTVGTDGANKQYVDDRVGNLIDFTDEIVAVAAVSADVELVAAIDDDVSTVAGIAPAVSTVAGAAAVLAGTASGIYVHEDVFTGDGTTTTWVLGATPVAKENVDLYINGLFQRGALYSVAGNVLTLSPAAVLGVNIVARTKVSASANTLEVFRDDAEASAIAADASEAGAAAAATVAANAALAGRTITAGTGLSGGGNLSADRTLSFNTGFGDGRYMRPDVDTALTGNITVLNPIAAGSPIPRDFGDARYGRIDNITPVDVVVADFNTNGLSFYAGAVIRLTSGGTISTFGPAPVNGRRVTILVHNSDQTTFNNTCFVQRPYNTTGISVDGSIGRAVLNLVAVSNVWLLEGSVIGSVRSTAPNGLQPTDFIHNVRRVVSAEQATTSGTTFDFDSLNAYVGTVQWPNDVVPRVVEADVDFRGVSLTGTDTILVQYGNSTTFLAAGYVGGSTQFTGAAGTTAASTTGFAVRLPVATELINGTLTLRLGAVVGTFSKGLVASGNFVGTTMSCVTAGSIVVPDSSPWTRIRIIRSGTNTFDAGAVSVTWKYLAQ